ncbi:MAG: sigma-70 family RNA polymerase sigma factor [Muribaculaceae bacterium]|nr:sigma-70 family RNA polymerase sigma factor [Muribaculaceae bacterium]
MNHNLHIDNHELIEGCKAGDKEALNLFYIRFAPRMLNVIRCYIYNHKDAEDILHDGFIVALTRLGSLRDPERIEYWLATIMKNLSLQFLHTQDVAQMLHDLPEIEDTPELESVIDLDVLESLIKKLPEGYQKVFRLAVLENKSHKEIAKLLGIAPNSSSSQLFHAKLMMRRLIVEYRKQAGVFSLLLIVATAGWIFWRNHNSGQDKSLELLSEKEENREYRTLDPDTISANQNNGNPLLASTTISNGNINGLPATVAISNVNAPAVTTNNSVEDQEFPTESVRIATDSISDNIDRPVSLDRLIASDRKESVAGDTLLYSGEDVKYAYLDDDVIRKFRRSEWSVGIGLNPGLLSFDYIGGTGDDFNYANPGDNINQPDPDDKQEQTYLPTRFSTGYQNYKNVGHHNYLPISFSLNVNKSFTKNLSVESGLTYTYLHSTFETSRARSHCYWHYIGIPLKLNFKTYTFGRFRLYASIGGEVDIPVYSGADVDAVSSSPDLMSGKFDSSVVWSLSASYGVSFRLSRRVEIFLEPTLQYHFDHDFDVPNSWTDNPWGFSLPIGFRFNF